MNGSGDRVGTMVGGRYRLVALAGRGSMAEVWRAEFHGARGFRRDVAVKRILAQYAPLAQYQAMFVREAQVNAALDHPNVVQVLDFGEDAAGLFLVTEWIEGLTMKDIADLCVAFRVRTSPVLIAAIAIEVLRALETAHSHYERQPDGTMRPAPLVHRDLAPSNVLLSVRGVVKLTDFGLARPPDDAGLTPATIMMPKLRYVAPEVVAGSNPSAQSDIYSLGVMLWEVICARRLWATHTPTQIIMTLGQGLRAPPVREFRPDTPPLLAAAIDRALTPRPGGRYRSAAVFARELADILRMIPERTDTTRLATEVANALELRKQLMARARPQAQPAPYEDNPRPTLEIKGGFPVNLPGGRSPASPAPSAPTRAGFQIPRPRPSLVVVPDDEHPALASEPEAAELSRDSVPLLEVAWESVNADLLEDETPGPAKPP